MKSLKKEEPAIVEVAQDINTAAVVQEAEIKAEPATPHLATVPQTATAAQPIDDSSIRDLAKRRLAAKRNLLGQSLDFLLIIIVALILASFSYGDAMAVAFLFCAFWGLRLLYRVYKFAQPSFKDGVAAYLRKRKEQQLEAEYNRLKKMGTDYVTNELSR